MDQSNSRDGNSSVSNSVSTFSPVARLKFERWLDERLYTAESPIHGTGLFTRAPIERGEILMKWGGVLVPVGATDPTLYRSSSTTRYDAFYYLTTPMTEPRTLDEWLNHSCDPNTWMEGDSRTVSARRDGPGLASRGSSDPLSRSLHPLA